MSSISRLGVGLATVAACLISSISQATILIEDAYNFREFRVNPPLNFNPGPDIFQLGAMITDSQTGSAPDGAVVKAKNLATDEIFDLPLFPGNEFGTTIPYSAERASSNWIIEVQSNVGSASVNVPAFGVGPGTGIIPNVTDLNIQSGPQPTLFWTLPDDLPNANDGNVDRLRVRIQDSNGNRVFDTRSDLNLSLPLTQTSYTIPEGFINSNGAFAGQVLVEGFEPFNRSRTYESFLVTDAETGGSPVNITDTFHFRDVREENSVGFIVGDRLSVGAIVDNYDGTVVFAEQNGQLLRLNQAPEPNRAFEFGIGLDYNESFTHPWTITALNGAETDTVTTHAIGDAGLLPFVRNVQLTPDGLTPTLSWDLPDNNSEPFHSVGIGLFDDRTDFRISIGDSGGLFAFLDPDQTSYTFPELTFDGNSLLEEGTPYVARVILEQHNDQNDVISRSISFLNFTPVIDGGDQPVEIPTIDEEGIFNFDFDVEKAVPVILDPFVAVGYDYATGVGDPNFATLTLPDIGDGLFDLYLFDPLNDSYVFNTMLAAGELFDFTQINSLGVDRFRILGIETAAGLDPSDVTAFMTTVTFVDDGSFTGTMTPITEFVDDPTIPEPPMLMLMLLGFLAIAFNAKAISRGNSMKTLLIGLLIPVTLSYLTGCAPTSQTLTKQGLQPLSQPELEALYHKARTVRWKSVQGGRGTATFVGGKATVDWGSGNDVGSYDISNGQFCTTWATVSKGEERCATIFKVGENEYQLFRLDGSYNSTFSFVK